jgi:hypothetical protein
MNHKKQEKDRNKVINRGSKKKARKKRKKEQASLESLKELQKHFHENYSNGR